MPTADTSSLAETIRLLESDLSAGSTRIAAHSDMPFAILRYDPSDEYALRRHLRLLAHSLEQNRHWRVTFLSLAEFVWTAIRRHEGTDYLFQTERQRGFPLAQRHVQSLVSPGKFSPLAEQIIARVQSLTPAPDVLFLVRAGGLAPFIYRSSALLDELHHHIHIPTILCYPGNALVGTDLRFYDLPVEGSLGVYNYRVKVYGTAQ